MRWEDERYVRLYTRDTATWKLLPWQAKALLPLLLRKVDRAGIADLDGDPIECVAALTDMPMELVEVGLPALLRRGVVVLEPDRLVAPNFAAAQEAKASDRLRAKDYRDRQRASEEISRVTERVVAVTQGDAAVTVRDESSRVITDRHGSSHAVTPSLAEPSLAVPNEDPPKPPAGGPRASDAPKDEPAKPKRRRAEPRPDEVPPAGTLARRVYDAITADPLLGPATTRPGGFATRIADPKTYPGVDVLAEVQRCGVWAETATRQILSGNGTLSTWLKRAADECARRGVAAVGAGAGPRHGLRKGPADTNASAAEWDRIAAGEAPEDFWSGQRAARGGVA